MLWMGQGTWERALKREGVKLIGVALVILLGDGEVEKFLVGF